MLGSQAMRSLIDQLISPADKVIFDDAAGHRCDRRALAGSGAGRHPPGGEGGATPREEVARQAKEQLEKVNARVLGIVANRIDIGRNSHYYYYYYGTEEDRVTAANGRPVMGRALARLFGGR